MADPEQIRVGDTLRIDAKVVGVLATGSIQIQLDQNLLWLRRSIVEAAEHIPAPKVFRRGDWVRLANKNLQRDGGLVLGTVISELPGFSGIKVDWPDGATNLYEPYELEHDEAPE